MRGTNAVGGIVGNIGKPKDTALTGVRNCYSTADVTATNANVNARAGGIAGLSYSGGVIENCYATGVIMSNGTKGAGGIIGYSDTDIIRCVAMNSLIINQKSGNLGRIAAHMSLVNNIQTKGVDCWATEDMIVDNAGVIKNEQDFITGSVTIVGGQYDGATKTKSFLSEYVNFETYLGWDFSSENNIWSTTMSNGFPIFQWMYNRDDYNQIDGHHKLTGIQSEYLDPRIKIIAFQNKLQLQSDVIIQSVKVYNTSGVELFTSSNQTNQLTINFLKNGIYILKIETNDTIISKKIIL